MFVLRCDPVPREQRLAIVAGLAAIVIVIITIATMGNQNGASATTDVVSLKSADYTQYRGLPAGVPESTTSAAAQWNSARASFDIVLFSSSTCAPKPTEVRMVTRTRLSVVFAVPTSATSCTANIRPTTTTISAPAGLLPHARVQLAVTVTGPGDGVSRFSVTID